MITDKDYREILSTLQDYRAQQITLYLDRISESTRVTWVDWDGLCIRLGMSRPPVLLFKKDLTSNYRTTPKEVLRRFMFVQRLTGEIG